ncbi:hypothetical protein [Aeromicrobium sp. 179-A 4D2 NHS]|uniref:hypothetical protein n=1 Tax=Aeromicrobium sp. 179-A 4D2 NHS TaxID=3142375 RepID=UPI00399F5262
MAIEPGPRSYQRETYAIRMPDGTLIDNHLEWDRNDEDMPLVSRAFTIDDVAEHAEQLGGVPVKFITNVTEMTFAVKFEPRTVMPTDPCTDKQAHYIRALLHSRDVPGWLRDQIPANPTRADARRYIPELEKHPKKMYDNDPDLEYDALYGIDGHHW